MNYLFTNEIITNEEIMITIGKTIQEEIKEKIKIRIIKKLKKYKIFLILGFLSIFFFNTIFHQLILINLYSYLNFMLFFFSKKISFNIYKFLHLKILEKKIKKIFSLFIIEFLFEFFELMDYDIFLTVIIHKLFIYLFFPFLVNLILILIIKKF